MRKILRSKKAPPFLLSYWPTLDSLAHRNGINSDAVREHFNALDVAFGIFVDTIREEAPGTKIIVTADHGLVDAPMQKIIWLEEHPALRTMLTLPLTGEPRVPFFYVRPRWASAFETYIQKHLGDFGELWTLDKTLEREVFGLYAPHPRFIERVGDYLMFMKENYVFRDRLLIERRERLIGYHGGWSEEEMLVPLILVE